MNIFALSEGRWRVQSRTDENLQYLVKFWAEKDAFTCDCPDGLYRNNQGCWHIKEVKESLADSDPL